MPGPLHGFRIIDLTFEHFRPAGDDDPGRPGRGRDQGGTARTGGDHTRASANRRGGFSASFLNNNRNKRSIALDLKTDAARGALLQLAATADVFIQNFRPGVAERMGLGEDAVRAVAPKIIYVSISGFGERGPYAAKPAYDPVVQALSSLATIQAGSDMERPRLVRTILPDKLTAVTASQAITAALLARARTGEGQHVRLSMLDAVLQFLWSSDMAGQTFVGDEKAQTETASAIDLIYATADGYISAAVQTNKQWEGLTRALDRREWLDDPRFRTPALRQQNIDDRLRLTQEALLTRPSAEWLERLTEADVPCAPVLTRSQVIRDPQVVANETLVRQTTRQPAGCGRRAPRRGSLPRRPASASVRRRWANTPTEILAELGYRDGRPEHPGPDRR